MSAFQKKGHKELIYIQFLFCNSIVRQNNQRKFHHSLDLYGVKVETPSPYLKDYTIDLHAYSIHRCIGLQG